MDLRLDHVGIKEGISHSSVNCIEEDKLGRKWFGTQNGLNCYDGIMVKSYQNIESDDSSLPGNGISDMHVDEEGIMWISTNSGFCCFNYLTEKFQRFSISNSDNESSNYTRDITPDRDQEHILWLGSYNGFLKFNKITGRLNRAMITSKKKKSKNNISSIFDDSNGQLWMGSLGGGIYVFNKENEKVFQFDKTDDLKVLFIKALPTYGVLVGTERKGLYRLDVERNLIYPFKNKSLQEKLKETSVRCVEEDDQENLWVGTQEKGLYVLDNKMNKIFNIAHDRFDLNSLPSNFIKALYSDNEGRVWIGTLTGGISIYDPNKYRFKHVKSNPSKENSILSNIIRGFIEDKDGNMWIATENGGVTKYKKTNNDFKHYRHIQDNENTINSNLIRGMYLDNNDKVWVFTFSGICYYDEKFDNFVRYELPEEANIDIDNEELRFCYTDQKDRFWIGSEKGLILVEPNKNTYEHYHIDATESRRISSNMTRFIFEEWNGRIILSTMGGNSIISSKEDKVINYYRSQSESKSCYDCFIFCMHENEEYIWLGTFEGLFRKDKSNNKVKRYGKEEGLANHVIYGILEDEERRLWISTNNGISCFDVEEDEFINYSVSDGLQSREFNNSAYLKKKDGEMLFGGVNGYNRFYPKNIKIDNSSVPLIFNKFIVSNEKLPKTQEVYSNGLLYVPYYANQFSFEFNALEFSHPQKINYKCILEGFDEDWINLKNNRVRLYKNVPQGEYVFRVKSTNKDKIWIENTISIAVRVEQPPWQQALNPKKIDLRENEVLEQYLEEMELSNKKLHEVNKDLINFNKKLASSIFRDALTGLYNRAGYIKFLEEYSKSEFLPLALFMIDVDNLKLINDNLGHETGDNLLIRVAEKLKNYKIKEESVIARIGGDEFAILVPNCNYKQVDLIDHNLEGLIQSHSDFTKDTYFSISYGYAITLETSLEELYSTADDKMYRNKRKSGIETRERTLKFIKIQTNNN